MARARRCPGATAPPWTPVVPDGWPWTSPGGPDAEAPVVRDGTAWVELPARGARILRLAS